VSSIEHAGSHPSGRSAYRPPAGHARDDNPPIIRDETSFVAAAVPLVHPPLMPHSSLAASINVRLARHTASERRVPDRMRRFGLIGPALVERGESVAQAAVRPALPHAEAERSAVHVRAQGFSADDQDVCVRVLAERVRVAAQVERTPWR